jgi:hypothetical protein
VDALHRVLQELADTLAADSGTVVPVGEINWNALIVRDEDGERVVGLFLHPAEADAHAKLNDLDGRVAPFTFWMATGPLVPPDMSGGTT